MGRSDEAIDTPKRLHDYLSGDLKPITCRLLHGEEFVCREMDHTRDGSVALTNKLVNADTAFRPMRHAASLDYSIGLSLSHKESGGVLVSNIPTKISPVAL